MKSGLLQVFGTTMVAGLFLNAFAQEQAQQPVTSVIAPGAKVELISSEFKFTEGPTCDAQGNVFFTDQPNDRIVKWSVIDGKISTFMSPSGRANGMYFD